MKKKFSKILGLALALAMVMAMLSACGGGGGGDKPADGKDSDGGSGGEGGGKGKIAYIVGNLGDKSFSDSGEAGMNVLRGHQDHRNRRRLQGRQVRGLHPRCSGPGI